MTRPDEILSALWPEAELGSWRVGRTARGTERSIVASSIDDVRHVLPWRAATVAASARRASDDRSTRTQLRDAVGVAGLLTVGVFRPQHRLGRAGGDSLVALVARELGHPGARGIVICGPQRANRKPVVQLHDRRGRTIAFVKVAFNPLTQRLLAAEQAALSHLGALPDLGFAVPPILGVGQVGSAHWLALGPIGVRRRRQPGLAEVDALARAIERTASTWTGPAHESSFVARTLEQSSGLANAEPIVAALAERDADTLLVTAASHGDFVPWNVLSGEPRPAVWDWERFEHDVPIGFDRLHHRVQVGIRHGRVALTAVVRSLGAQLDVVLHDVDPAVRAVHLDWYLAQMLCRYESDVNEVASPRLDRLISDITSVLKERHP